MKKFKKFLIFFGIAFAIFYLIKKFFFKACEEEDWEIPEEPENTDEPEDE